MPHGIQSFASSVSRSRNASARCDVKHSYGMYGLCRPRVIQCLHPTPAQAYIPGID